VAASQIAKWLADARDGSDEALGHLLEAFRPFLLGLARQRVRADLKHRLGFSDVVQDTYEDALKAFPRFDGESEDDLRKWLRRILVTNVAQSYAQAHRQKRDIGSEVPILKLPGVEAVDGPGPASEGAGSGARARAQDEALQQALSQLGEDYREIIQLHHYERLTFAEAGERLGRSEDATRKLWSRAIDALRELLENVDASR
jgi:RNA polymerase sigma-70 factor (ECF subfamily)